MAASSPLGPDGGEGADGLRARRPVTPLDALGSEWLVASGTSGLHGRREIKDCTSQLSGDDFVVGVRDTFQPQGHFPYLNPADTALSYL